MTAQPGKRSGPQTDRLAVVDGARTVAIALMVVYHFCFDLRHFGIIAADFEHDAFWLVARGVIVTSFLLLVGVSLALAASAAVPPARFWRRIAIIAAAALGVSVVSAVLFPRSFIYFGVLHCIAVTSVLARPYAAKPRLALIAGLVVIAAGTLLAHPAFDARPLSPIGFAVHKPLTEDYVPLFPWAGVVLLGIAAGHALAAPPLRRRLAGISVPGWLAWPGRHSLLLYLVHQPVFFAILTLAS
jgi:uncharacterized membrane protein